MQPDESQIDGGNQVMISGDVQNPQFVQTGMQPQTVIIDPNTGMPQNVIIMQQPSSAPKVVGILVIIWGSILTAISLIGLIGLTLLIDKDSELYVEQVANNPAWIYILTVIYVLCYIYQILGGSFMIQKKKMGIYITWACLGVLFIGDIAIELIYPDLSASQQGDFGTSINLGFSAVCSGICGLLVAIPLMISDSGMDNSMKIL
jgi:hypothetical protein